MAGHWEGDLIIALNRSAIGAMVDPAARFTVLVHSWTATAPPRPKNWPAMDDCGVEVMREALADRFAAMPEYLRRSLTWDPWQELACHVELRSIPISACSSLIRAVPSLP